MPNVDPLRIMSDAAYMTDFIKSQTRDVLNHYMELMGDDFTNKVVNFNPEMPARADDYNRGVLAGLRMAQMIPENVLAWAKQVAREDKKLGKLTLA